MLSGSRLNSSTSNYQSRVVALLLCISLILISVLLGRWALAEVKQQEKSDTKESINTVLTTTSEAVIFWAAGHLSVLENIAMDPRLVRLTQLQIEAHANGHDLGETSLEKLRIYFAQNADQFGNVGFFLITEDRMNIASMRDENIGESNVIHLYRPELLNRVFEGESLFIPPIPSDVSSVGTQIVKGMEVPPTMFFATPVFDNDRVIIAVLTQRVDPFEELSSLTRLGRIGESGETYCFDREGLIMTDSHFTSSLKEMGYLEEDEQCIYSFSIRDPGNNLIESFRGKEAFGNNKMPFTLMATSALKREDSSNFDGYRDYRGVRVVGAWRWLDDLNMGITTEIDVQESMRAFYLVKGILISLVGVLLLLMIFAAFIVVRAGEKVAKTLENSKNVLEATVEKRTYELVESEGRFRQLADTIQSVFWLLDWDKKCMIYVSPAYEKVWGFSVIDLMNDFECWIKSIVPMDRQKVIDLFAQADQGLYKVEYQIKRPDGTIRHISDRGYPVLDSSGKVTRIAGIAEDISSRVRVEQQLRKLSGAVEHSPLSVIITDREGIIEYVNPHFTKTTGYDLKEVSGKTPRILKSGKHPSEFYRDLWRTVLSGNDWSGDMINRKKDGREIWEHAGIAPIFDDKGNITHIVSVREDITARKKLEFDLLEAKEAAESATRTKSDFLANMSHEIRTPMNAIIGMSHLCLGTELDKNQQRYIETVNRSAKSLLGILNDILDFSKIEAGSLTLESIPFCMEDILRHQSSTFSHRAHEKGIELIFSIDSSIPLQVVGDPLRLNQILMNLIGNSLKFTETGEVFVDVTMGLESKDDIELLFSVRDTGIGMTAEQMENLFRPFAQADTTTTRKYGGTGLGLSICKKLVELFGGEITTESTFGQGSIFRFNYHLKKQENESTIRNIPEETKNLRLLIVDDAESVRMVLTRMLDGLQIRSHAVESGLEGLLALKEADLADPYDLVLVDWDMPEMDGIEMVRQLKNDPAVTHQPRTILVTAWGQEDVQKKAKKESIDSILLKPMTVSNLLESIRNVFLTKDHNDRDIEEPVDNWEIATSDKSVGARILLVEDNFINQELAQEILQRAGYFVSVASNGREGCEMVENGNFQLVLMDIHMPEMDGLEATTYIREVLKEKDLPIIAMTANVMAGDREKCLEQGMNAHVGKPFEVDELFEVLEQHLGRAKASQNFGEESVDLSSSDNNLILPDQLPDLQTERGLVFVAGNKKLYLRLLREFVSEHRNDAILVEENILDGNLKKALRIVHTMKGVSSGLGANALSKIAGDFESAIRNNETSESFTTYCRFLDQHIKTLVEELEQFFNAQVQEEALPIEQMSGKEIIELMEKLHSMLIEMDPESEEVAEVLESQLKDSSFENEVKSLKKYTHNFDFQNALQVMNKLNENYQG